MKKSEVIVIGGGLAGLTAAIHLSRAGKSVVLLEKNSYPNHKVCGEYVSNEVRPYLDSLGVSVHDFQLAEIDTLTISTKKGKAISTKLPLGGFGISRFALDHLLYKTAVGAGAEVVFETAVDITFEADTFRITTTTGSKFQAPIALGAYGKRSVLDKKMDRGFSHQKSPWLGVKCHYEYPDFPGNQVALHNFEGGYGGLSKTETGTVNFCYLTTFESFKKQGTIEKFNANSVAKNPHLGEFLNRATPSFEKPLSIAQISFSQKSPVTNHVLMCGDSAGLIHPLCGNGMAMAIHAAKLASEVVLGYLEHTNPDRKLLEDSYTKAWKVHFEHRLWMGRQLQRLLLNDTATALAMNTIANSEKIIQAMIRRTHGKPILV